MFLMGGVKYVLYSLQNYVINAVIGLECYLVTSFARVI